MYLRSHVGRFLGDCAHFIQDNTKEVVLLFTTRSDLGRTIAADRAVAGKIVAGRIVAGRVAAVGRVAAAADTDHLVGRAIVGGPDTVERQQNLVDSKHRHGCLQKIATLLGNWMDWRTGCTSTAAVATPWQQQHHEEEILVVVDVAVNVVGVKEERVWRPLRFAKRKEYAFLHPW